MSENRPSPDQRAPRIDTPGQGRLEPIGDLTFDTVGELFAQSVDVVDGSRDITLDLCNVTRTDSAGLALLVEWLRQARRQNVRIQVINMPVQMHSIARMSKLDGILLNDHG